VLVNLLRRFEAQKRALYIASTVKIDSLGISIFINGGDR